jgi:CDP-diacylglycerol---glycerol-3-phosphate 3-phosphatidyltransferase
MRNMTLYALKPRFQALLRPAVAALGRHSITAHHVTVAAAAGSIAVGLCVYRWAPPPGGLVVLPLWRAARMALNAADGMLAREFGQQSPLGAYLNELCDVVSDAALYLPFAATPPFVARDVFAVVLLSGFTEFAGVLGPTVGAQRRYDGPMGKSDRALAFGALSVAIAVAGPLPSFSAWLMPPIAAALLLTTINRVRGGLAEMTKQGRRR